MKTLKREKVLAHEYETMNNGPAGCSMMHRAASEISAAEKFRTIIESGVIADLSRPSIRFRAARSIPCTGRAGAGINIFLHAISKRIECLPFRGGDPVGEGSEWP